MISNVVKQFDGSDMRTDIISSWKRSEANGLNPKQTVLPPIDSSTPTLDMFDREWQSLRDLDIGFYEVFNLFLQGNNTAVFFIDLDLNIIMQDGNELLLEQLNTINMEVGANLSETRIGTNAAALAALNKKKSYVAGSEHYLDILKDYACEASPIFIGNNIPIAYVMYVVNTKAFNRSLHMRLNEFIDMQNRLFNLASSHMELFLKQEILESGVDPKECGTIFINSYGFIIKVNAWVLAYFNIETKDVVGKELSKTFPELFEEMGDLKSEESVWEKDILFRHGFGSGRKMLAKYSVLKLPGGNTGTLISLSETKLPTRTAAKKTAANAHYTFEDLIGKNSGFQEAKKIAEIAALSNCNVMIVGESGSGKELFAQSIHNKSDRRNEPFISINCAALPKDLIYSELFGYVEGAFTGAKKGGAPGKFELANKGTLFLDEISEIPNEMQAVLLRVLEGDTVARLGSSVSIPIDVRVIAATNRDICKSVATHEFRLDLYHRLSVVRIDISPLRHRKDDIPVLAEYFLKVFNVKHGKNIAGISPEAVEYLQNCLWLGNARELRNVIERGVIFCSSETMTVSDLPKELAKHHRGNNTEIKKIENSLDSSMPKMVQETLNEKRHIEMLLEKYNHNKTMVAQDLGITRATLYRKLKLLGIE